MSILQAIVDNVGDLLGTSKLAQLNRRLYKPILGMAITREEYNMYEPGQRVEIPDSADARVIRNLKGNDRRQLANNLLDDMVENGVIFRDDRIHQLAARQQTYSGSTHLTSSVRTQLSPHGRRQMHQEMTRQRHRAEIGRRTPR